MSVDGEKELSSDERIEGSFTLSQKMKIAGNIFKGLGEEFKNMVSNVLFLDKFKKQQLPMSQRVISIEEHEAFVARADDIRRTHRIFKD